MSSTGRLTLVLLAASVVFTVPALTKDLWTPDEPRYALVAQEMMTSGDFLVPRRNGELYREKPPLLFWLIAASSWPAGAVTAISTRVPSIVCALITVALTFGLARRMFGDRVALWSILVLTTSFRFWWQSNSGHIDMLLTACTTLSLYAVWRAHEARASRWAVCFHIGTALGLLAKGPPALLVTGAGAITYLLRTKGERRMLWLWVGIPLSILPVAVWFVLARGAAVGDVSGEMTSTFSRQIAGRLFGGISHYQPLWYYLTRFPADWLPWTLFLPWTLVHVWRTRREGSASGLLLCWVVPALIVFHISAEKRALYLLPFYPVFAIMTARSLLSLVDEGRRAWLRGTALVWVPLMAGLSILPAMLPIISDEPLWRPSLLLLPAIGVPAFAWTALLLRLGAWRHWPVALVVQTAALYVAVGLSVFPVANAIKTCKPFCEPVRLLAQNGPVRAYSVRITREEYVFYSRTLHTIVLEDVDSEISGDSVGAGADGAIGSFRSQLLTAAGSVPLFSPLRATPAEREALSQAIRDQLVRAEGASVARDEHLFQIRDEVASLMDEVRGDTPAVLFVMAEDWRWILAFAGDTEFLRVLKNERVSSRDMILLGNEAAFRSLQALAYPVYADSATH